MKIALNINPIDTTADRRPADLQFPAWNDLATIQIYKDLIDHLLAAYYGLSDLKFKEYFKTLGLRNNDGSEKTRLHRTNKSGNGKRVVV